MHPWSEVWSKLERTQPEQLLHRWLATVLAAPEAACAKRVFGEDPPRHATQLAEALVGESAGTSRSNRISAKPMIELSGVRSS